MNTWPPITEGTLTPAYGRDYSTSQEAQAAFLAGADFRWNHHKGSTYCSIRDYQPGERARIRYNHQRDTTFQEVPDTEEDNT